LGYIILHCCYFN